MGNNNDVKLLTDEELKKEKRKKQLAIIKASNELLQYARDTVLHTDKIDEVGRKERVDEINQAMAENDFKAETYLNATKREVEESTYNTVSEEEKKKYQERLEKRGLTDESVRKMDAASVSQGTEEGNKPTKRKHVPRKRKEEEEKALKEAEQSDEIIRLPNEEELMKKTMLTKEKLDSKVRENTKMEDKVEKEMEQIISSKKVTPKKEETPKAQEVKEGQSAALKKPRKNKAVDYDFDFASIPQYVQYDIIPLPSNGECYPIDSPLRCGRIPVAYLTAADENIISSPNMYRDGKIIDIIVERKVLDKRIDTSMLCKGDRDAIVLWLRATGWGTDFPIVATNPNNGKKYYVTIDLSKFKYKDFGLAGDEEGNFTYVLQNKDEVKFNFATYSKEDKLRKTISESINMMSVFNLYKDIKNIKNDAKDCKAIKDEDNEDLKGCIEDIENILGDYLQDEMEIDFSKMKNVTEQMLTNIVSINGNSDEDYVRTYIENLRIKESLALRTYIEDNTPGVDFSLKINIPESDGGGSFDTFLRLDNSILINI